MKIIGITGKTGSGKTTLTEFFGERKNVGVIYLDDLLNGFKEDKLKNQIKSRNKQNSPKILGEKLRYHISNNRILFKLSMLAKKMILKKKIEEQIRSFKSEGKDAVVIDGIHLKHMTDYKMFDKVIYVRRPYRRRLVAVQERDGVSKAEIAERDLPFKRSFSSVRAKDYDYIVDNIYRKEELKAAAERIYDEVVGVKTFDERYRVETGVKTQFRNIVTTVQKAGRLGKRKIPDER